MTKETMRAMFLEALQEHNKVFDRYDDTNEKYLKLTMIGENGQEFNILLYFSVRDNGVQLVYVNCYDFPNFSDNLELGWKLCNQLNSEENIKYYIDDEGDVVAEASFRFNADGIPTEYSPELVVEYANTVALSAEAVYPMLSGE